MHESGRNLFKSMDQQLNIAVQGLYQGCLTLLISGVIIWNCFNNTWLILIVTYITKEQLSVLTKNVRSGRIIILYFLTWLAVNIAVNEIDI